MADTHLILEIDDAEIVATLAQRRRSTWLIQAVRRADISGAEGASLALGLRTALQGLDIQKALVHLAFSERRFLHFVLEAPRMPRHELDSLILRECRRLAGGDQGTQMIWASRELGRGERGTRHAVVALTELAWQPMLTALQRGGIEVASVTSLEEAASRVPAGQVPGRALLLDVNQRRARLLYLEQGAVVQRRRIPPAVGAGDADAAAALATHLALEVPRTIEFFANQGLKAPEAVAISPRFGFDATMTSMVAGELPVLALPPMPWLLPEGDPPPGLPTHGILRALLEGSELSLLSGHPRMRRDLRPSLAAAILSTTALALGLAGVVQLDQRGDSRALELQSAQRRVADLQRETERLTAEMDARRPHQLDPELAAIVGTRRPMSLFLARVCEASAVGIGLRELKLSSQTGISVSAQVQGGNRMDALQRMSTFTSALQRLPFLADDRGNMDPQQSAGGAIQFEFQAVWGGGR